MPIVCTSRIERVDLYARGAWVTRTVEVPGTLPPGEVALVVPDVTILAEPGSVRAEVTGRRLVSVGTGTDVPAGSAPAGDVVERVRELEVRKARLEAERDLLATRRQRLSELSLRPELRGDLEQAIGLGLDAVRLTEDLLERLDERHLAVEESLVVLRKDLEAAQLAAAQASSRARMGAGHPRRRITLALAGDGELGSIHVTYAVPTARWWPTYTLRLTDGGRRGTWLMEALVSQLSGEDWEGVAVSLATADLHTDARLPELGSLRLGRAQPAPRRGYRPPPPGLDLLYAPFDRAFPAPPPPPPRPAAAASVTQTMMKTAMPMAAPAPVMAPQAKRGAGPLTALSRAVGGAMDAFASDEQAFPEAAAPPEEPQAVEPAGEWLDFDRLTLAEQSDTRRGRLVLAPSAGVAERAQAAARLEQAQAGQVIDPLHSRGDFDHRWNAGGRSDVPSDGWPHRVVVGSEPAAPRLRWRTVPREAPEVYREAELVNPFAGPLLAGPVDVYLDGTLLVTTLLERGIDRGASLAVGLGVDERLRVARNARTTEETAGLLGGKVIVDTEVAIDVRSALGFPAEVEVLDRIPVGGESDVSVELVASEPGGEPYEQKPDDPIEGGRRWRVTVPASGAQKVTFRYRVSFPSKQELIGGNRRD